MRPALSTSTLFFASTSKLDDGVQPNSAARCSLPLVDFSNTRTSVTSANRKSGVIGAHGLAGFGRYSKKRRRWRVSPRVQVIFGVGCERRSVSRRKPSGRIVGHSEKGRLGRTDVNQIYSMVWLSVTAAGFEPPKIRRSGRCELRRAKLIA